MLDVVTFLVLIFYRRWFEELYDEDTAQYGMPEESEFTCDKVKDVTAEQDIVEGRAARLPRRPADSGDAQPDFEDEDDNLNLLGTTPVPEPSEPGASESR